MIGWLWRMIVGRFGCDHMWAIHDTRKVFETPGAGMPCGVRYHLRCDRCGNMKMRTFG